MEDEKNLEVKGMTCSGCEGSVKKIISRHFEIDIEKVSASHEHDRASIMASVANIDSVLALLDDAGFPSKTL